jgi:hypothetical protein
MIPRLILATFVSALVSVSAPCATASALLLTSLSAAIPVAHFNEVYSTTAYDYATYDWMNELIALNPTAMVSVIGNTLQVTGATDTVLVKPETPMPKTVKYEKVWS